MRFSLFRLRAVAGFGKPRGAGQVRQTRAHRRAISPEATEIRFDLGIIISIRTDNRPTLISLRHGDIFRDKGPASSSGRVPAPTASDDFVSMIGMHCLAIIPLQVRDRATPFAITAVQRYSTSHYIPVYNKCIYAHRWRKARKSYRVMLKHSRYALRKLTHRYVLYTHINVQGTAVYLRTRTARNRNYTHTRRIRITVEVHR